jgi:hypothetical protein
LWPIGNKYGKKSTYEKYSPKKLSKAQAEKLKVTYNGTEYTRSLEKIYLYKKKRK